MEEVNALAGGGFRHRAKVMGRRLFTGSGS